MAKPWEKYSGEVSTSKKPWEKYAEKKPADTPVKTRDASISDFIPNLDTPLAVLKGFNQGVTAGYMPNIAGALVQLDPRSKGGYVEERDAADADIKATEKNNPLAYYAGQTVGGILPGIAMPFTKMAQGAKLIPQLAMMAADGFTMGAVQNPGNKKGTIDPIQLSDRLSNANFGAMLAPAVGGGVKAVTSLPQIGRSLKGKAEEYAYRSSSPKLSDVRVDQKSGMDKQIGRYMLDNDYVQPFGSTESVAEQVPGRLKATGSRLDDVYTQAHDQFSNSVSKPGYDPIRDKSQLMAAADEALGDTKGKAAALRDYETYLDQIAKDHGDAPNNAARAQYQQDVQDYIPKYRNFLKEKKAYQGSVGLAGDDVSQPVLSGMYDDLQSTANKKLNVELEGKPASVAAVEPYEVWSQQDLIPITQRPAQGFNISRGDDLLPMRQQMQFDETFGKAMAQEPYQSEILNLSKVPRTYTTAELPDIISNNGQTKMIFAPDMPIRPVRPSDVRNPMSPRRMNDIKGAMDDVVNYNRNPFQKDPASERAFYSGRSQMSNKIDNAIDELGGTELYDKLKSANKSYQIESKINKYSTDQMSRDSANKSVGLTDTLAALKGLPHFVAKKAGEKFGYQTMASGLDPLGNLLQKSPVGLNMMNNNSPEIQNLLLQRYMQMNGE